jgi:UDP-glucuronate 4-epimerase
VLVTGAAGFIGFHTSKALAAQPNTLVIGLDNFSSALYSSKLKQQREELLRSCCNVTVIHGDIRNSSLLQELFICYHFTQIVHLAAQAGVRLSVQQPAQYIDNNVKGTVQLLEVIRRQQPTASIVYASSSSVYGVPVAAAACSCNQASAYHHNINSSSKTSSRSVYRYTEQYSSLLPSNECYMQCGQPASVYAASKRATEEVVAVYSHQYGIIATGKGRHAATAEHFVVCVFCADTIACHMQRLEGC